MPTEMHEFWPIGLITMLAFAAAYLDLRYRRIPNWLCAVALVCGLALAFFQGLQIGGSHALHALIALLVGLVFFRFGMFGGGDVKFYTGIASFFALTEAVLLLLWVGLSGFVLLVVWFIYRRLTGVPLRGKNGTPSEALPYGVAIGLGAVLAKAL